MEPNDKAEAFAEEFGLAKAAGSDAHSAYEMGTATVTLPEFDSAETFRTALQSAEIQGRLSSPHVRLISRHAALSKKRHQQSD
jgi:hypothetical protein